MEQILPLSRLANVLLAVFEKKEIQDDREKITVNPLVAKFATWYERFRNAMDYREEEVILRAAIERILKRRLLFGGNGKTIAEPLIRELVWARYFPDNTVSESVNGRVEELVDTYLALRHAILKKHRVSESMVNQWMYQLLSSSIEKLLHPQREKEVMSNFVFTIMKKHVSIIDDTEQTRDAQVFLAVRRSFAKDDIAFLRYHLFLQVFGDVTPDTIETIAQDFPKGYKEIQRQLLYPRRERIYNYTKNVTAVFLILYDVLHMHRENVRELVADEKKLHEAVFKACQARYDGIASKVRRAIVRSVVFIIITKGFFAFTVEGTLEALLYGKVMWGSILLNTAFSPLLMVGFGLFLRPPGRENTQSIHGFIRQVLFEEEPRLISSLQIRRLPTKSKPFLTAVFTLLWVATFVLSFGLVVLVLTKLNFSFISQGIFLFFLAIVAFLSYRIRLLSKVYAVQEQSGWFTPVSDFFLMPIVRVGRDLTEGISQVNIFLFIFDLIIETPFKGIFGFFEQWFFFLQSKREDMS